MRISSHESFRSRSSVCFLPSRRSLESGERPTLKKCNCLPPPTEHLLAGHTFDRTWLALLKIGIFMVLVDVFHYVLGALKCVSCSVFCLQSEHLPLQTPFKDREVGGLQHSVSNGVLPWGSAQGALVATMLIGVSFDFHGSLLYSHLCSLGICSMVLSSSWACWPILEVIKF